MGSAPQNHRRRSSSALVCVAMIMSACGSDGATNDSATTSAAPTTSVVTTTTTESAPTTTTTMATTTTTRALTDDELAVFEAYVTAWNAGDVDALAALFTPDLAPWQVTTYSATWDITLTDLLEVFDELAVLGGQIEARDLEGRDDGTIVFQAWHTDALTIADGFDPYVRPVSMRIEDGRIIEFTESLGGWKNYTYRVGAFETWLTTAHPEVGRVLLEKKPGTIWDGPDACRTAMQFMEEYAAYRAG